MAMLPGLIGLAPATNEVYLDIIREVVAESRPGHDAETITHTIDFAEAARTLRKGDMAGFAEHIVRSAQVLDQAGVDFLILTSNTGHVASRDIATRVTAPLVDIRDVAAREALERGATRVGIVGTSQTINERLYHRRLEEKFKLVVHSYDEATARRVDEVIFEELVHGVTDGRAASVIEEAVDSMRDQVDCVLLACTDLTHIRESLDPRFTIDTTLVHARAAGRLCDLTPAVFRSSARMSEIESAK